MDTNMDRAVTSIASKVTRLTGIVVAFATALTTALAQERQIKVGFIAPLSGTVAITGKQGLDGLNLFAEMNGGKLGGIPLRIISMDDQAKPDIGLQAAHELIEREKVDVIIGPTFSSVIMATFKTITDAKIPMVGPVGGPSVIAGKQCSPYYFSTSWQNEEPHEAMGQYLQDKGLKRVYLLAPNYLAGKETLNGFKRRFKGEIAGEVYTPLNQLDFAAEIAQVRQSKPDAVYVFYPGGFAINFVKQYRQSELMKEIPLYSASSIDSTVLPAIGEAAIGTVQTASYNVDLNNDANIKFREAFVKKYNYQPSFYSAYVYDAAQLLDSAIREVKGSVDNKAAFIAAIEKADFSSVRGKFKFDHNHFPIQDFYRLEVIQKDGKIEQVTREVIMRDKSDAYADECKMGKP
jgi:branched-chain amino acid transport system substrate-binding protein